jgi:hypothetical protein
MPARSGKQAWEKYYKDKVIETTVKANTKTTRDKNYVYAPGPNTKTSERLDDGTSITVHGGSEYQPKLPIIYDNGAKSGYFPVDSINKPREGTWQSWSTTASKLAEGTRLETLDYLNGQANVSCRIFTDADEIAKSVLAGLESSASTPDHVLEQVLDFFMDNMNATGSQVSNKFNWIPSIHESDKKRLGIYLGELLPGYFALKNRHGTDIFSKRIIHEGLNQFVVPDDQSFGGIDSAFIYSGGSRACISSKFGEGAEASVWNNIMPLVIANKNESGISGMAKDSTIKQLIRSCESVSGYKSKGRAVLYYCGVKEIMKNSVVDPEIFFLELKRESLSPESASLYRQIKEKVDSLKAQPGYKQLSTFQTKKVSLRSITAVFSRMIADRLNMEVANTPALENRLKSILAGKSFFQLHMDDTKFINTGEIYFKVLKSSQVNIIFKGDKSAVDSETSLEAGSGTLNYKLQ